MSTTITSPLYILHLSTPESPCPTLLKDNEIYQISTPYYNASVPIWRDTLPTTAATISTWKAEWIAHEVGEVICAIGAWIVTFNNPRTQDELSKLREILSVISEVIKSHQSESYDVREPLMLAVGMPQPMTPSLEITVEEWENVGRECGGWEWIDGGIGQEAGTRRMEKKKQRESGEDGDEGGKEVGEFWDDRNELGEKVGLARLKEALEANEWEAPGQDDFEELDDLGFDDDNEDANLGFQEEAMEAQMEMWGLHRALNESEQEKAEGQDKDDSKEDGDEANDQAVQELEAMMLKLQAVKDMGADMAEGERKKFAAKAVRDVLKKM